jgi:hypothetical protein
MSIFVVHNWHILLPFLLKWNWHNSRIPTLQLTSVFSWPSSSEFQPLHQHHSNILLCHSLIPLSIIIPILYKVTSPGHFSGGGDLHFLTEGSHFIHSSFFSQSHVRTTDSTVVHIFVTLILEGTHSVSFKPKAIRLHLHRHLHAPLNYAATVGRIFL